MPCAKNTRSPAWLCWTRARVSKIDWSSVGTFNAPIGGIVLALAVFVVFAVGLVVALREAGDVGKREAIVRCGVIDRGPGPARMAVEQIARTGEARGKFGAFAGIAAPEPPRAVAEAVVPLGEARRMVAELISAGTEVPRLGDQLDARQDRVLPQRVEKSAAGVETIGLSAKRDARDRNESHRHGTTSPSNAANPSPSAARADATG